jgi:hypothetical protein
MLDRSAENLPGPKAPLCRALSLSVLRTCCKGGMGEGPRRPTRRPSALPKTNACMPTRGESPTGGSWRTWGAARHEPSSIPRRCDVRHIAGGPMGMAAWCCCTRLRADAVVRVTESGGLGRMNRQAGAADCETCECETTTTPTAPVAEPFPTARGDSRRQSIRSRRTLYPLHPGRCHPVRAWEALMDKDMLCQQRGPAHACGVGRSVRPSQTLSMPIIPRHSRGDIAYAVRAAAALHHALRACESVRVKPGTAEHRPYRLVVVTPDCALGRASPLARSIEQM